MSKLKLIVGFVLPLVGFFPGLRAQSVLETEYRYSRQATSLEEALESLREQGAPLAYRSDRVEGFELPDHDGQRSSLNQLLDRLLTNTGLVWLYSEAGRRIDIFPDPVLRDLEVTFSGQIQDAVSGELLIGANIYLPELRIGTVANNYGKFSLGVTGGAYDVIVSYTGYASYQAKLLFSEDKKAIIKLNADATLPEILVPFYRDTLLPLGVEPEGDAISIEATERLSGPGGEADPMRTLSLLPGITTGADGLGGIFIRGSDQGQNLVQLDGVPLFNYGHAAGLFSIFNLQAIRRIDLYKEALPAKFGGRLSGVLDVHTRDGNLKFNEYQIGTSLGSSRFTAEGPLIQDTSSFLITGRYLWARPFIQSLSTQYKRNNGRAGQTDYQLYDINFKLNHQLGKTDRIFFSFFRGLDDYANDGRRFQNTTVINEAGAVFQYESLQAGRQEVEWNNTLAALRYNHDFPGRLFANLTLSYSQLNVGAEFVRIDSLQELVGGDKLGTFDLEQLGSQLRRIGLDLDAEYHFGINHRFDFGVELSRYTFLTNILLLRETDGPVIDDIEGEPSEELPWEATPYASLELKYGNWQFRGGLRAQLWTNAGQSSLDMLPRLLVRKRLNPRLDIQASLDFTSQPVHRLSSASIGLPTDMWVPSTSRYRPARARQWSTRARWLWSKYWRLELGAYARRMTDILIYAPDIDADQSWSNNVSTGSGNTSGLEFLLTRRLGVGRWSGWLSYTWANSERTFGEEVNLGRPFPFRFDREHALGLAVFCQISPRVDFNLAWRFASGAAYSFNLESFNLPPEIEEEFTPPETPTTIAGQRNQFRLPADHRLDVNFRFRIPSKMGEPRHQFTLGVYNVYNRRNPVYYDLRTDYVSKDGRLAAEREFVQVFIAPLLPVFSYELSFSGKKPRNLGL
ncbi:MAG: TonB-dependent receptor [Bacteroidota bacterium]